MFVRLRVVLVALLSLLGGAVGAASTAAADPVDDNFLAELQAQGVHYHVTPEQAIEGAHLVCQKLDNGMTPTQVAYDVLETSTMPGYRSGYFVGAAIHAYCPQHRPEEAELGLGD
ncbi:DUF732 domain-containing protein [Mycobacterium spongiae]|uniref:DUF732 domain-containing protein n=1 Tax=Mycobacterium spongiae TaxID=886343 RepID=A0A975JXL0_9MYCO|nr:DUF732 domain-containing protein [Mycobacterium spongiae]QUR67560.1 DUF732 domain-containing protein [Mycobacterium spongiae]